jgi:phosphate uptake regulator
MRRKLIKHGESSLTVSLPRRFVKENNLKKGQEVDVVDSEKGLFISPDRVKTRRSISIDVSGQVNVIRKILGATYKSGYDEVNIKFSSVGEIDEIKHCLQSQFSGYEIIRLDKNNVSVRKISEDDFEEFANVIRRFFTIINDMTADIQKATETSDYQWLKSISLIKYESDRLADYCRRAINLRFKSDYKRTGPLYTIVEQIEKISDNYQELCEYISDNKVTISVRLKQIIGKQLELQHLFTTLFFKFDLMQMSKLKKVKDGLENEIKTAIMKSSEKELYAIVIMDRIVNITYSINGPLMSVHL